MLKCCEQLLPIWRRICDKKNKENTIREKYNVTCFYLFLTSKKLKCLGFVCLFLPIDFFIFIWLWPSHIVNYRLSPANSHLRLFLSGTKSSPTKKKLCFSKTHLGGKKIILNCFGINLELISRLVKSEIKIGVFHKNIWWWQGSCQFFIFRVFYFMYVFSVFIIFFYSIIPWK